ncbi:MAG: hypothetical protein WAO74_08010 [Polaribacter sp.]
MKRLLQILKIIQLFLKLPFDIANGAKKSASIRIKQMMISAKLL